MPHPRRKKVFGSCLFCHQEYPILHYGPPKQRRVSWCQCPGARYEQKRRKNSANRAYWLKCLTERGKAPQVRRVRGPEYRSQKREECLGVRIKNKWNTCRRCGDSTPNRYYCHTCWGRIESFVDVDMAVDVGESRRMGVRV